MLRTNFSRLALSLAAVALLHGCQGRERSEAHAVMHALEVVRAAPKDQKLDPAEALGKLPCTAAIICNARDRCADVYRHFARGMESQRRVMAELEELEKKPPQTTEKIGELSRELDRADQEINGAEAGLPGCEEAASLMRRTYGI
jgi:hypothetical protein